MTRHSFILTLLLTFASLVNSLAVASYVFSPSLSYTERTADSDVKQKSKLTIIDFRLGYKMDSGLYIGGIYSLQDETLNVESSDSYLGLSVGWMMEQLFVVGSYLIYGEKDLSAGGVKYSKGNGFQLDVMYLFPLLPDVFLGPQLSYLMVDFKDRQVNGVSTSSDFKTSGITPAMNLTVRF